jgi:hypothetical protein
VAASGPSGSLLVSLAIFNGHPFKDHWAYFVRKTKTDLKGIMLHAQGDVVNGFTFEIKRNIDFNQTSRRPRLVDLAWVASAQFNSAMWNNNVYKVEKPGVPICPFEVTAHSAPVPAATLNAVSESVSAFSFSCNDNHTLTVIPFYQAAGVGNPPRRVRQRNCQTWVLEAGTQLVAARVFSQAVHDYLTATKQ